MAEAPLNTAPIHPAVAIIADGLAKTNNPFLAKISACLKENGKNSKKLDEAVKNWNSSEILDEQIQKAMISLREAYQAYAHTKGKLPAPQQREILDKVDGALGEAGVGREVREAVKGMLKPALMAKK